MFLLGHAAFRKLVVGPHLGGNHAEACAYTRASQDHGSLHVFRGNPVLKKWLRGLISRYTTQGFWTFWEMKHMPAEELHSVKGFRASAHPFEKCM